MKIFRLVLSLATVGALGAGCAKGTTTENNSGAPQVKSQAPTSGNGNVTPAGTNAPTGVVGLYYGYIARQDGTYIPLDLDLENKRDSSGGPTELSVSLTVGLFGGVTVNSTTVNYDWTSGLLSAHFSGTGNSTVDFTGHVVNGAFTDATLKGTRSGMQTLVLSKTQKDLVTSSPDAEYTVRFSSAGSIPVAMSITPKLQAQPSADASDLPLIPALNANFNFNNSPNNVTSVVYDPLMAQMDLVLDGGNRAHFDKVALPKNSATLFAPKSMTGSMLSASGSYAVATLQATASVGTRKPMSPLQNIYYVGTYTGSESYLSYKAVGSLQYLGSQGKNPPELAFPSFPNMQLTISVCINGEGIGPMEFQATAADPVTSMALFQEDRNGQKINFQAAFTSNFTNLAGTVTSLQPAKGTTGATSRLQLTAVSGSQPPSCTTTAK